MPHTSLTGVSSAIQMIFLPFVMRVDQIEKSATSLTAGFYVAVLKSND